ncbi:unnamed protein product [Acanthoscelides obtectus]|uniref:Uncharacterized protein n=1 Tax=Acanthoscelides obtectus TaxID=200917 RepID=A0A9P0PN76_ACAOB|nr:unnamed protein product [Acanthoscelides obtectus]CAK1620868.1 hypothetical protein AOBTE_LOCUS629 [Acanthoscelides obtectus]
MKYLCAIFAIFSLMAVFAAAEEPEVHPMLSVRAPSVSAGPLGACECNSCNRYCSSNNYIGGFCYLTSCYCVKYQ